MDVRRSPLRALAPLALVAFSVALLLIVSNARDGGGEKSSSRTATEERTEETAERTSERTETRERESSRRAKYTIKPGDTLDGIAQENGTTTSRLLEINPDLDPQSLVAGQEICLRPSNDCGS